MSNQKNFLISALLSLSCGFAFGQSSEWISAHQYIERNGADKTTQGVGAVFHSRIETRTEADLIRYAKAISSGRNSPAADEVCKSFFEAATSIVNNSVRVSLTYAKVNIGSIGCVIMYTNSGPERGYQIFFIEKVGRDVYELVMRN